MSCELICTGWYSSEAVRTYETFGDDSIRRLSFRPLWWQSVDRFIQPQHVLIVDSASPVKPEDHLYTSTKFSNIELLKNPGHSQNCETHYCGYMASVILGLEFALHNDVDFFLYVEQDALVYGADFVKKIQHQLLSHDLIFGAGDQDGDIQQSIFAANKRGIRKFLSRLHSINNTDRQIAPEMKFMNAASLLHSIPFIRLLSSENPRILARASTKLFLSSMSIFKQYAVLPFGYGRVRPINFSDDIFYFQQGSADEINAYKKLTGFNDPLSKY